jgi:phasin
LQCTIDLPTSWSGETGDNEEIITMAEARNTTSKPFGNEAASQGAAFAKDMSEKTKAAAEETTKAFEQTFSSVAKDTADFNRQWLEMIQLNTRSTLEFMQQLASVKSPTEFFELSAAHSRKQFETFTEQSQQLVGLAQKATTGAIAPMQAGMKNPFIKAA